MYDMCRQLGSGRMERIMISFVVGQLEAVSDTSVIIDHQGIGLEIIVSGSFLDTLPPIGSDVKIYTHFHVREDAMQLFGFASQSDKDLFRQLITVSGIGPKGGLAIMSTLTGDEIRFAILSDDEKTIAKAPGIGAKTAKKLILELKDKIDMTDIAGAVSEQGGQGEAQGQIQADAIEALSVLGYSVTEATKAVRRVALTEDMTVEDLLKHSLKNI